MNLVSPYHTVGLHFRRLDLHVHTRASKDFDGDVEPDALVAAAKKVGLEGLAVTDHNSGAAIDEVKEAGKKCGIAIFPGVEISCSGGKEGIHIIALFDPSCGRAHIEGLLSALGLVPEQYGDITAVVNKNPIDVVCEIQKRGGLAVLAHANSTRGALGDMKGQQRTNLVQHPFVSAAEGTDFQNAELAAKHKRVVDLLDGTDPTYRRHLAVYQASDNPSPSKDGHHGAEGIGTRSAYFKLDRLDLDGLRQCFADPEVRIRQDFEYQIRQYPHLKEVRVKGGFLDGASTTFHEGLNSILGAKGAGKSLLVEFVRFALAQPPTNDEIRTDHDAKLQTRLEDYGSVEVVFEDETGKDVTIRRLFNPAEDNPYEGVEDPDIAQVFPVLFLSQNEIIRIAETEEEQLQFLDRFFDFRAYRDRLSDLEHKLQILDGDLAVSLRATVEARGLEKRVVVAKADLTKLDQELKNPIFDEYAKLEVKSRAFREQGAYVESLLQRIDRVAIEGGGIAIPEPASTVREDPALRRVVDRSREAQRLFKTKLEDVSGALREQDQRIEEEFKRWLPIFDAGKKRYEETVQRTGGDYKGIAAKRARLVKALEELEVKLRDVKENVARLKGTAEARQNVLGELKKTHEAYTQERRTRAETIETESGARLRVKIHEASNVEEFRRRLTALKRGSYLRDVEIDQICTKVTPENFIRGVIRYSLSRNTAHLEVVAKNAGIDLSRMRGLAEFLAAEFSYEDLLALEYKAFPEDRPEIAYNVGEETFEPLGKLSVGQKCTALLIIALGDGTMPVIIDQPEDSLDIRSIWEDICAKVRRGKERRQFIFTTHNSSVAVAADSDKFIIMEADAHHGRVVASGSMDHPPISDEAMRYLEGGADTYRAKYKKYRGDQIV